MALPLIVGGSVIFAAIIIRFFFNPFSRTIPLCPFNALTGLYCPGCGGTRCMYSLLSGDIFLAIRCWPPILIALPAAAALWGMWFASAWRGEHFVLRVPQWLLWTLVIGVLGFGVVRNFPALSLLRPPF